MTPLDQIPLNSWTWLTGSAACFALYYRSFKHYRRSANELPKYLAYFALTMGIGQSFLAVPSFLTLDTATLRTTYMMGEAFVYMSAVAQAAIVWCLMLRSKLSLRAVTIPVAGIGVLAWFYSLPRASLTLTGNFITYRDPLFSTIVIGLMLTGLFLPVGIYFMRSAAGQRTLRGILFSLILGVVYIGVGLSTGGVELLRGEVITPGSAISDLIFFSVLLGVLLWPRRLTLPKFA